MIAGSDTPGPNVRVRGLRAVPFLQTFTIFTLPASLILFPLNGNLMPLPGWGYLIWPELLWVAFGAFFAWAFTFQVASEIEITDEGLIAHDHTFLGAKHVRRMPWRRISRIAGSRLFGMVLVVQPGSTDVVALTVGQGRALANDPRCKVTDGSRWISPKLTPSPRGES